LSQQSAVLSGSSMALAGGHPRGAGAHIIQGTAVFEDDRHGVDAHHE
jgi:hypothetical protein